MITDDTITNSMDFEKEVKKVCKWKISFHLVHNLFLKIYKVSIHLKKYIDRHVYYIDI